MSVQMIGALGFFLAVESSSRSPLKPWVTWLCVALSVALVVATLGRGPIVALVGTVGILLAFGHWRRVASVVLAGACVIVVLALADVQVETSRGVVSASSIIDRQSSIVSYLSDSGASDADPNAAGTISWRVVWWQNLLDEAFADPRILVLGRGYGPDLRDAVADLEGTAGTSYQQGDDVGRPLRSPHNIAMTILARSGLVGLGLWLFMFGAVGWRVVQRIQVARRERDSKREMFGVWLLLYLAATVLIACFGVLLEGPFAAIPFFCTLGIAAAWAAERRREVSPPTRA
jgi:O-antigen ligase